MACDGRGSVRAPVVLRDGRTPVCTTLQVTHSVCTSTRAPRLRCTLLTRGQSTQEVTPAPTPVHHLLDGRDGPGTPVGGACDTVTLPTSTPRPGPDPGKDRSVPGGVRGAPRPWDTADEETGSPTAAAPAHWEEGR